MFMDFNPMDFMLKILYLMILSNMVNHKLSNFITLILLFQAS